MKKIAFIALCILCIIPKIHAGKEKKVTKKNDEEGAMSVDAKVKNILEELRKTNTLIKEGLSEQTKALNAILQEFKKVTSVVTKIEKNQQPGLACTFFSLDKIRELLQENIQTLNKNKGHIVIGKKENIETLNNLETFFKLVDLSQKKALDSLNS